MYESRCGICCNQCERKDEVGCKGCLEMKLPFWGAPCEVKSCCQEKKLNHCGQCVAFPCEVLTSMGKAQGYDPMPKIEQCRKWAAQEKESKKERG